MLKNNFLSLFFLLFGSLLTAQVTVSGHVTFANPDESSPVPMWEVFFNMGDGNLVGQTFTNEEGYYEIGIEIATPGQPPWTVETFDICTGDQLVQEIDINPDQSDYVIDFVLCQGIDPPDPVDGCEAFFYSEQIGHDDEGYAVEFFDLSYHSGEIDSWEWTFGDGTSATEQSPTHVYAEAGDYLVSLTIIGAFGDGIVCTSTVEYDIVVWDESDCDCPADVYDPVCVITPSGAMFEFINPCYAECAGFDAYIACEPDCACPAFYAPVCVTLDDGTIFTFENHCFAECEGYSPDQWIDCEPNECDCPDEYNPVCIPSFPGGPIISFDNACIAECAGFAPGDYQDCDSDCICPEFYEPVCVVNADGDIITFDNFCFAQCAGYGPDHWIDCEDECDCPEDIYEPVCVATPSGLILTFVNPCYAECAGYGEDVYYHCDDEGCVCPEYLDPVCVITADGEMLTFDNPCFAECEGYGPDQWFHCDPIGCECPDIYDPVCVAGFAGIITFPNTCFAECAGFSEEFYVDCEEDCICPDIWDPVCVAIPDNPLHTIHFPNACYAECAGYGPDNFVDCEEDCICPDVWDPVCVLDADGHIITFGNACEAACEGYGEGDFVDCQPDCVCPDIYAPVCVPTDTGFVILFDNACYAECAGYGSDQYFDCDGGCVCPDVWDPVCVLDADGHIITFGNACEAECAGYGSDSFVDCEDDCICPAVWAPVCVASPAGIIITFGNSCEAECAGYGPDDFVDCENNCGCPDIWDPVCVSGFAGIITFPNECVAICEGFSPDVFVDCEDCHCDDYYLPVCVIDPLTGDFLEFSNPCYAACAGYGQDAIIPCFPTDDCISNFDFEVLPDSPLSVQFTDLSYAEDGITSWHWDFGDGETSNEQNPLHTYADGGVYDITLVITSEHCGEFIAIHHICIGDGGGVGGPDCQSFFFLEQANTDDLLSFQFIDLSLGNVNAWAWDFGDGTTSTEQNPTHTYAEAGDYIVTLSIFAGDCQSTVSIPVTAGENIWYGDLSCRAWFLPITSPDGNEVFFINLSSADAIEFEWNFGDGEVSNNPLALHSYAEAGTYTVTLTIVTSEGCTNSFSATVTIGTDGDDGFGANPTFSITTSTDEVAQLKGLQAAPNPTNGDLRVSWTVQKAGDYNWQLFDINGRLIEQRGARSSAGVMTTKIDLSNQPSGIYLLRLQTPDGIQTLRLSKI